MGNSKTMSGPLYFLFSLTLLILSFIITDVYPSITKVYNTPRAIWTRQRTKTCAQVNVKYEHRYKPWGILKVGRAVFDYCKTPAVLQYSSKVKNSERKVLQMFPWHGDFVCHTLKTGHVRKDHKTYVTKWTKNDYQQLFPFITAHLYPIQTVRQIMKAKNKI